MARKVLPVPAWPIPKTMSLFEQIKNALSEASEQPISSDLEYQRILQKVLQFLGFPAATFARNLPKSDFPDTNPCSLPLRRRAKRSPQRSTPSCLPSIDRQLPRATRRTESMPTCSGLPGSPHTIGGAAFLFRTLSSVPASKTNSLKGNPREDPN